MIRSFVRHSLFSKPLPRSKHQNRSLCGGWLKCDREPWASLNPIHFAPQERGSQRSTGLQPVSIAHVRHAKPTLRANLLGAMLTGCKPVLRCYAGRQG
jgi:hypothetical protein